MINVFGIGTNLVTCQKQPALGMVYKIVEFKGKPTIKLSEEVSKICIPGAKSVIRYFSEDS
jgi:nicotinate phosphoribosyltransferase